jgi:rhamnose transport system permease protein
MPREASSSILKKRNGNWLQKAIRPETGTAVLLVIGFLVSITLSPYFLDARYLIMASTMYMEIGVSALAMTFIIIAGQIDLSVASTMALVGCVTAIAFHAGIPMPLAIVLGLLLGLSLGLFNGILITRLQLPAIAVTLGTLALYRGIAQVLMGDFSLGQFPDWFIGVDKMYIGGTLLPLSLVIFLVLGLIMSLLLHFTVLGRQIYSIGTNEKAARYSGVPINTIKLMIFGVSGLFAGIGGIMMISRFNISRFSLAMGNELDVITAVVLGGTDIFGGRGSIVGTMIALFLVATLRTGMGLANIKTENQLTVIGGLLIFTIIVSNVTTRLQQKR